MIDKYLHEKIQTIKRIDGNSDLGTSQIEFGSDAQ